MPDIVTETEGEWSLNVTLNGHYTVEGGLQFTPEMAVVEGGAGLEIVLQASSEVWREWLRTRLKRPVAYLGDTGDAEDETANELLDGLIAEALSDTGWELNRMNPEGFKLALTVTVWRRVVSESAFDIDYSADGGSFKGSQLHTMAMENLQRAEARARTACIPGYVWAETDTVEVTLA